VADLARDLHAGLAYPPIVDYNWILQAKQLRDCPVSVKDMNTAIKIWGPSVAMLKRKTTRMTPPPVQQDVVAIPKEFWELHKQVTLMIDIFFANTIPFLATYSLDVCFLSVTHMENRKADTILKALKGMHNYYLQRGFQIVFVKGDGEFKPLEPMMSSLYGAPRLNLSSANEHVPEIERRIWVIKEQVQAVVYLMPFNSIPLIMLIHAVMFVTKQLNLFPVKGSVSACFSPKQIMSGESAMYKFCAMGFGQYCQIHEESQPWNSLAVKTQGAISLGMSENVQGGHKFLSLATGKIVTRRAWTKLPTPQSVIDRIHAMAKGQPSMPVYNVHMGNPIGNESPEYFKHFEPPTDDEIPGVDLDTEDLHEITGVDTVDNNNNNNNDAIEEPREQAVQFDLGKSPDELPIVETTQQSEVNAAPVENADQPVRRSSRVKTAVKQYVPSMQGKKYSFATTQLGRKLLDDETYQHDPRVVVCFMEQLSAKAALNKWGKDAKAAGLKETHHVANGCQLFDKAATG
jgi:hypothetical protein